MRADELMDQGDIYVAQKTGVFERAVESSRGGVGPNLGAAYLILGLSELTANTPSPSSLMEALKRLFQEAVISIQSFFNEPSRKYLPAQTLHTMAIGIQVEMLSANDDGMKTNSSDRR
jgi:hypothetical protein